MPYKLVVLSVIMHGSGSAHLFLKSLTYELFAISVNVILWHILSLLSILSWYCSSLLKDFILYVVYAYYDMQ